MSDTPTRDTMANTPMHYKQVIVVVLCCIINMADGYDVLSLALAAPEITRLWDVSPQMLGLTFSANSVGLVIGAFFVAPVADLLGRRAVILSALTVITVVHWLSGIAPSIWIILVLRLFMGIGLGTLVVSLNVMVSEYSNERWRNLLIALLHTGFSVGMAVSGIVAALMLETLGWRYIFFTGGAINMVVLFASFFLLLESPEYLTQQQPKEALARINRILTKIKKPVLSALPPKPEGGKQTVKVGALLTPALRRQTILIWIASFAYALVGYFLMNWKPQVLVNAGLSPTQASYVGIINGICGTVGHISIGYLSRWFSEVKLTAFYFAMLTVMLIVFGTITPEPVLLLGTSGIITLFTVGAYTGIFLVSIKFYETDLRSTGVGFVVGWGRVGSIIGPMLGGLLVGAGLDRSYVFAVFASISVVPVITMLMAAGGRLAPGRRSAEPVTSH